MTERGPQKERLHDTLSTVVSSLSPEEAWAKDDDESMFHGSELSLDEVRDSMHGEGFIAVEEASLSSGIDEVQKGKSRKAAEVTMLTLMTQGF